ncbi:unnamed protein product [Didymodactylos carnosus]|uniref:Uncharacterized protein n=1 Tax=Didymodactylos carnosus TaxID=1234261 RepID=A0A814IAY2_9BILA|nr:unnamed protein product [Didymodactylos carnosus]CAF1021989.1 unnamed protein product [Didymodactylos carnosus]CAF3608393.1 unnamed protein product [Didymodactylos carnosus]CAF3793381.1 unnamed protein product [Didymodactylos carnosus]
MGQHLSTINLKSVDLTKTDDTALSSDAIVSDSGIEDINFFLCEKTLAGKTTGLIESDHAYPILNPEALIKQIQNHLSLLTKPARLNEINTQMNEILMENVLMPIASYYGGAMKEIKAILQKQQQLQISLVVKLNEDKNASRSIFEQPFANLTSGNTNTLSAEAESDYDGDQESKVATQQQRKVEFQAQQLSYFAIRSLTSMLLILIKSAQKNDPTIVHQILELTSELCEQLPMKCLSPSELSPASSSFLFKSLKPLTNYINDLSSTKDLIIAKQAAIILLSFSIAKASFKDILPILSKLIFNTVDIYNAQGLFLQLNNGLTVAINERKKQKEQLSNEKVSDSDFQSDSNPDCKQDKDDGTTSKETTG